MQCFSCRCRHTSMCQPIVQCQLHHRNDSCVSKLCRESFLVALSPCFDMQRHDCGHPVRVRPTGISVRTSTSELRLFFFAPWGHSPVSVQLNHPFLQSCTSSFSYHRSLQCRESPTFLSLVASGIEDDNQDKRRSGAVSQRHCALQCLQRADHFTHRHHWA